MPAPEARGDPAERSRQGAAIYSTPPATSRPGPAPRLSGEAGRPPSCVPPQQTCPPLVPSPDGRPAGGRDTWIRSRCQRPHRPCPPRVMAPCSAELASCPRHTGRRASPAPRAAAGGGEVTHTTSAHGSHPRGRCPGRRRAAGDLGFPTPGEGESWGPRRGLGTSLVLRAGAQCFLNAVRSSARTFQLVKSPSWAIFPDPRQSLF